MNQVETGRVRHRVLLVEDDARFATIAISLTSDAGMDCVLAASASEARAHVGRETFDVAVVDLGLPDEDGLDLVRWLARGKRPLPVLVLTGVRARETVIDAVRAGANGYLFKDDTVTRLVPAIEEVIHGGGALSVDAMRAVLDAVRVPLTDNDAPSARELTPRELEVLSVLARGLSYEQCALVLDVSLNTVRTHVRSIYDKLGAASRTEAVLTAMRLGVIAML